MNNLRLHYGYRVFIAHKSAFLLVMVLMISETLVSLSIPYLIGKQSQYFLSETAGLSNQHWLYVAAWVGLFAAQALLRFFSGFKVNVLGARIMAELSCRLYDHIQVLPIQYFQNTKRGDVLSMLSNDLAIVSFFASSVLTGLIPNLMVLVGAMVLMYLIDPFVALAICSLAPLVYILVKLIGRNMQPISRALVQRQADSIALASENIGAISLIKAFNRESSESNKFKRHTEEILDLRSRQFRLQSLLSPLVQFLSSVCILVVILICVLKYQAGSLTVPNLISLLLYGLIFTRPLSALAGLYGQVQHAIGATSRLLKIYHLDSEPKDEDNLAINVKEGQIEFSAVGFGFNQEKALFEDVSFVLPAKKSMLIWGKNGCGKTTLLHLLMRFYEPRSGSIKIDGQDISKATTNSVRAAIGLVSQDVLLVNGSVFDNITYGVVQPNKEKVLEAAKRAGLDNVVANMAQGYDTQVGEGGVRLSGGQRQRIALARALLLNPVILLLDEPTSMLDDVGREAFKNEFAGLFTQFTVIIISHDPTLADVTNYVFNLKQGQLQATQ